MRLMGWVAERGSLGRPFVSGADLVEELPHLQCGIVLIDVHNAGSNGFDVIAAVARTMLACPIIAMTEAADTQIAVESLKRGAVDFLVKPILPNELHEAVAIAERLMDQRRALFEQAERDREALERLSPRERQILNLLSQGKTSKSVAAQIGIGVRTVEAHRASLLGKLEVETAAGAIAIAVRYETALLSHACRIASAVGT